MKKSWILLILACLPVLLVACGGASDEGADLPVLPTSALDALQESGGQVDATMPVAPTATRPVRQTLPPTFTHTPTVTPTLSPTPVPTVTAEITSTSMSTVRTAVM